MLHHGNALSVKHGLVLWPVSLAEMLLFFALMVVTVLLNVSISDCFMGLNFNQNISGFNRTMSDGLSRQSVKEMAVLIAIKNNFALVSCGREVYQVFSTGEKRVLCCAANSNIVWHMAYKKLKNKYPVKNRKRNG